MDGFFTILEKASSELRFAVVYHYYDLSRIFFDSDVNIYITLASEFLSLILCAKLHFYLYR